MTEPTDTERAELNAWLARRQGYKVAPFNIVGYDGWWILLKPDGTPLKAGSGLSPARPSESACWQDAPDFTRDPAASRELVEWVATNDERWFIFRLELAAKLEYAKAWPDEWPFERAALTASPLLIAIAADAATGGKDER